MGLKKYKAITPGLRGLLVVDRSDLWKGAPEKTLTVGLKKSGGRNNRGVITVRHIGGGHKRKYRIIDFRRREDATAMVEHIAYDPNRTAFIALITYEDGKKSYILAPHGLKIGDKVESGSGSDIRLGNAMPLSEIPVGTIVHNVELKIGKGGQLARSAGSYAQIVAKDMNYVQLRLSSGEIRMVHANCWATIGVVSNVDHHNINHAKAGRKRWLGVRPTVRGVAMNPVDHPHGGGQGKTAGGRHPVTPWGVITKGKKTRNNKLTDRFIVRGRSKSKSGRR